MYMGKIGVYITKNNNETLKEYDEFTKRDQLHHG